MAAIIKTPILGSATKVRATNADAARLINMYPEITLEGGKEPAYLSRAPGLRLLAEIGEGPIRGLWQYGGYLYVASGSELYKVDSDYNPVLLGGIGGTGPASMADNGNQLFIACNPTAFIYNSLTEQYEQITDGDFPGAQMVSYLDGFFVFSQPDSQQFWVTSLLDGTAVDPLDFASAEGFPDDVVSLIVDHRELWLFGTMSTEVWYNVGGPDFPFERIPGAFNEVGCIAPYSVAKMDNQIYWLGQDARGYGIVYRATGYIAERISTHSVEYSIQQFGDLSEAIGFTYQQAGHTFYWLTFPGHAFSWVFDIATGTWTERAGFEASEWVRHRANCQCAFNSEIIVGDRENGNLYAFDLSVYSDDDAIQKWLRSWRALPTGANNLTRTAHHMLQLDCETGTHSIVRSASSMTVLDSEGASFVVPLQVLDSGGDSFTVPVIVLDSDGNPFSVGSSVVAVAPQIMLRWSDDGGHTWSNEHWAGMGKLGQYGTRVIWRRLGMTQKLRDRVYEVSGTDPVSMSIMGAALHISPTAA